MLYRLKIGACKIQSIFMYICIVGYFWNHWAGIPKPWIKTKITPSSGSTIQTNKYLPELPVWWFVIWSFSIYPGWCVYKLNSHPQVLVWLKMVEDWNMFSKCIWNRPSESVDIICKLEEIIAPSITSRDSRSEITHANHLVPCLNSLQAKYPRTVNIVFQKVWYGWKQHKFWSHNRS